MAMDVMERIRPGSFSAGLETYLRMDAFANSVPMDLWNSLAEAVGDPRFATRMLTWSENGGYPLVSATVSAGQLVLRQRPHQDPESNILWSIPVVIGGQSASETEFVVVWLDGFETRISLSALPGSGRPVVKAAGMGLYRVDYEEQWPAVMQQLRAVGEGDDTRWAADTIQDAFGLLKDQRLLPSVPLDLIRASASHAHAHGGYPLYTTWLRELDLLGVLMQEETPTCQDDYQNFVMYLLMSVTTRRGDNVGPKQKRLDSDSDKIVRPLLLDAQMRTGCPVSKRLLCPRVRQALWHPWEVDNDMRPVLLMTAIRGDCEEWGVTARESFERIVTHYEATTDPSLRHHLLFSLPAAKDPALLRAGLDYAYTTALPGACPTAPTADVQQLCRSEFSRVFSATVKNPAGGARAAWDWMKRSYLLPDRRLPSGGSRLFRLMCGSLSSQDVLDDMLATFSLRASDVNSDDHPGLFALQQNIAQRAFQGPDACSWLARDRQRRESQATPGPAPPSPRVMIVHNAKAIHTVTHADGSGSASAFVTIGNRFAEVCETVCSSVCTLAGVCTTECENAEPERCSLDALRARYPGATELDVGGKTIVPGLIDAHGHLPGVGHEKLEVNLRGASSITEVVRRIRTFVDTHPDVTADGGWVRGARWDQTLWDGPDTPFPTKLDLDAEFPSTPIYLSRVDGHAGWCNSAAIRAAEAFNGERIPSVDPDDGQIIRLANGEPSGVLLDGAMGLIRPAIPSYTRDVELLALRLGVQELNKWGLTSMHDAGVSPEHIELYKESVDRGDFSLRNYVMVESNACSTADERAEHFCASTYYPHWGDCKRPA